MHLYIRTDVHRGESHICAHIKTFEFFEIGKILILMYVRTMYNVLGKELERNLKKIICAEQKRTRGKNFLNSKLFTWACKYIHMYINGE